MGVDILRDVDASRSHGIRVVQSRRDEHTEKAIRQTARDSVLEGSELSHELEDQAEPAQVGEAG